MTSSLPDAQANVGLMYEYTTANAIIHRPPGIINFAFMANGAAIQDPATTGGVSAASSQEMDAFRAGFQLWQDVANVTFVEAADGVNGTAGIVRIGNVDLTTANNAAENFHTFDINSGVSTYGEILVDPMISGANFAVGSFSFKAAVHEIGHTLSFADISNVSGFPNTYENTRFTIMSYSEALGPASYASTPMLWDIYAVQQQYGANTTTRSGNTTYGFHSSAGRDVFDFSINSKPFVTIYDTGGLDQLDLSGFSQDAGVDLHDGEFSSVAGLTDNLAIAFGTIIEAAIGGSGNDTINGNAVGNLLLGGSGNDFLYGNAGNDTLRGEAGNDFLRSDGGIDSLDGGAGDDFLFLNNSPGNDTADGGAGNDTVLYVNVPDMVTISLNGQVANGASIGSDTLLNIENATGGNGNDVITGTPGANALSGSNGNDLLVGDAGDDTLSGDAGQDSLFGAGDNDQLSGGNGNDQLNGGDGSDTLMGDGGNDTLFASAGDDTMNGGDGFDWYDLSTINGNATVTLGVLTAFGSASGTDALTSIENVRGGSGNDRITGDIGINVLDGGGGNDTIVAGPGSDVLIGGTGTDVLSFELITQTVTADLSAGAASSSQTGSDSVSGFENIIGGTVRDLLTGDAGANNLDGRSGNDKLVGGDGGDRLVGGQGRDRLVGGTGNDALSGNNGHDRLFGGFGDDFLAGGKGPDTLEGGPGTDTADYGDATGGVNANLVRGSAFGTGVGTDRLSGIENLNGSDFADRLSGDSLANDLQSGSGDDTLIARGGDDTLTAQTGDDAVSAGRGKDYVEAGPGADTVNGGVGNDVLKGEQDGDVLRGQGGNDHLLGAGGSDTVRGGNGGDVLIGGRGGDMLIGGNGPDRFEFDGIKASRPGAGADHIADFMPGQDSIDLRGIDADPATGANDDFHLIQSNPFSGTAGELRYVFKGPDTYMAADVDGDAKLDFRIIIDAAHLALQTTDFLGVT